MQTIYRTPSRIIIVAACIGLPCTLAYKAAADPGDEKTAAHISRTNGPESLKKLQEELETTAVVRELQKGKSLGLRMRAIPSGIFCRGSQPSEVGHNKWEDTAIVEIPHAFLLSDSEITETQWERVVHKKAPRRARDDDASDSQDGYPVHGVNWFEAAEFCNLLSRQEGLGEYYAITNADIYDGRVVGAQVRRLGGTGYRLPTSDEWEYACRGGTRTSFNFGEEPLDKISGLDSDETKPRFRRSIIRPVSIRSQDPNVLGLYDMHGNVAEWCDNLDDEVVASLREALGVRCKQTAIVRGGGLGTTVNGARSASLVPTCAGDLESRWGFRIARSLKQDR